METTTTKTAKPYDGSANVAAIIALAKRSTSVTYRTGDSWDRPRMGKVWVTVSGRGSISSTDYGKPAASGGKHVYVPHKATEVRFSSTASEAELTAALAGFEAELVAAGWTVLKRPFNYWLVVGPGWREYMTSAYDWVVADKIRAEEASVTADREAAEITRILEARGVARKHVETTHGDARVTLRLADIEKLIGLSR